jgi:hypothetical protein
MRLAGRLQYSLETLFLITLALAVELAVLVMLHLIGVPLAAIGAAALLRTMVYATRLWRHGKVMRLVEKLLAYLASVATTLLASAAALGTLLIGTILLTATEVAATASSNLLLDFAAGAIGVFGAMACLLLAVPIFYCIYWQSLPPEPLPERQAAGLPGR